MMPEDFAIYSGEGMCEVRWSIDGRYVTHMEYCGVGTPTEREVYVYDTQMLQSAKLTNFTEGVPHDPPFTPFMTAEYSLHWTTTNELLIGTLYTNASGPHAETLRYDPETGSLTVIDTISGEDWVASHSGQRIAYRAVSDFDRTAYSARIADKCER